MVSDGWGLQDRGLAAVSSELRPDMTSGLLSVLVLSGWCGLVAGLLETGILFLHKQYFDRNQFYGKSMQFAWLIPLANLLLFLVAGSALSPIIRLGARARRVAIRFLATLALLPPLLAAFPRIHGAALLVLAVGAAVRLVPLIERRPAGFARLVRLSFPGAACVFLILVASSWGMGKLSQWREASRPLPPPNSPNVLLIVLDTVAAGHLSLLGYNRLTSPAIDELASRGICFKQARATAPWTLPSHASMFTGRFPHELSTGWFTPLDAASPTVAEYLGTRGFATAGFAANVFYCATDSGLARGFTTYRDFIFPELTVLHLTAIVSRIVDGFQGVESLCTYATGNAVLRSPADLVWRFLGQYRKDASAVNGEFLDWLSTRPQPNRPFFAFLNYYDAHTPYELPETGIHRFGVDPRTDREETIIRDWVSMQKRGPSERQTAFARDAYDDCVAHLDEQLGILFDELEAPVRSRSDLGDHYSRPWRKFW